MQMTIPKPITVADHVTGHPPNDVHNRFDLILPCCNPPGAWTQQLIEDFHLLQQQLPDTFIQLILVNDGSVRNFTATQIQELKDAIPDIRIINHPVNRGKGYALRLGVAMAESPYQVCSDYDMPFGVEAICRAYHQLLLGSDVVAGVRGRQYTNLLPIQRRFITRINRLLNRYVLRLPVDDAQAGLKAFNGNGRREFLSTRINGFLYDSEFVHRSGKNRQLAIAKISIRCRKDIRFSDFKLKTLFLESFNFVTILLIN